MKSFIAAMVMILLAGGMLRAQQTTTRPDVISYQGMVASSDGSPVADGEYSVTMTLYGDEGGAVEIWQDTYTAVVRGGVFNIYLGSGTVPLPAPSRMDRALWIGTRIADGEEMRPLTRLSASPYAINVPDNAITTRKLADRAVTADKMNLEYLSGVSVNGKKIAIDGKVLNLQAGEDIKISYDELTQSLVIGSRSSTMKEGNPDNKNEGSELLGTSIDSWAMEGDGVTPSGAYAAPDANDWIGTRSGSTVDFNIRVRGIPIMSYQSKVAGQTPNVVGGYSGNNVGTTAVGNVIAGGGEAGSLNAIAGGRYNMVGGGLSNSFANPGTVGGVIAGGQSNVIGSAADLAHYGVIGGGFQNRLTGTHATIAGGRAGSVSAEYGTVGGGIGNIIDINGRLGTIAGGDGNEIHAADGAVGGGYRNKITNSAGSYSTIAGGYTNNISGQFGSLGGGQSNLIEGQYSTIAGGLQNYVIPSGQYSAIGGGIGNRTENFATTIAGGEQNIVAAAYSAVGGGQANHIDATYSMIGGGKGNTIIASTSTIAGGSGNFIGASFGAIGGGTGNQIIGNGLVASIPRGQTLTAQSYGQTVVGVMNIPSGNLLPGSVPTDDPIFIVGNGIQGFQSNAFEVSYNGHSTVFDNTFGNTPVILGSTYTDNVIYAWGHYDVNSGSYNSFGVRSIVQLGAGWYQVQMDIIDRNGNSIILDNSNSVTATVRSHKRPGEGWDGRCATIMVSEVVHNAFDVYIADPGCGPVDENFDFKVTGRQP